MSRRIKIAISTESLRVINRLSMEHIKVERVNATDKMVVLDIDSRDRSQTLKVIGDLGLEYSIVKDTTIRSISKAIMWRSGLIVSLILCVIMAVVLSNMTLDIRIQGNEITPTHMIETSLQEMGVTRYRTKIRDLREVELALGERLKTLAYVVLRYEGTRLMVDVREEIEEPLIVRNEDGDIIANSDGIITRVIVTGGTPRVKAGDSVRAGDILIESVVEHEDEKGNTIREDAKASGKVYARVYLREDIALGENNIRIEETGKTKCYNRYFNKVPRSPYARCKVRVEKRRLYSLLPLEYERYTYSEEREKVVGADDKNYKDYLINHAYERLNERLFRGEIPINEWIFEKRLDNVYIISVYYEVEKLISGGKLE